MQKCHVHVAQGRRARARARAREAQRYELITTTKQERVRRVRVLQDWYTGGVAEFADHFGPVLNFLKAVFLFSDPIPFFLALVDCSPPRVQVK